MKTDRLHCISGVNQGDELFTTLFSIFINDLIREIKGLGLENSVHDMWIVILLYADNIVLLMETECELQTKAKQIEWMLMQV